MFVCVSVKGGKGGAYLKNRNQTINVNVGMIGHASSEDERILGGPGHVSQETF